MMPIRINHKTLNTMGSGYGSVGRAVASNTRVHGSNPVIDEFLHTLEHLFTYCQLY